MLKVNEERMLKDYDILKSKQKEYGDKIEKEARQLASLRNYTKEKEEAFVAYVKSFDDGLSKEELIELSVFETYIEDIVEEVHEDIHEEENIEEPQAFVNL